MQSNLRLKLEHTLEGVSLRDDLAFPYVIGPITGAEGTPTDGDKCIVEVALQTPVSVDDLEGIRVGDRYVVGGDAYEGPC